MPDETKTVAQQLADSTSALSALSEKSAADAKAASDLLAKAALDAEASAKTIAELTASVTAEKARADKAHADLVVVQEALDKATKALAHPSYKAVSGAAQSAATLPQIGGEPKDAEPKAGGKPHTAKLLQLQAVNAKDAFDYRKAYAAELAAEAAQ
jgi:hypothetical protein